ncbi:MAG: hypothetical protein M3O67_03595 [Bacteroidota bacterium]|nr:hypothetical protein [Bacteroidota bacterium]
MFFQWKKKFPGVYYSMLNADVHSHLIPGIDDGAPDLETSLQLIEGLANLGYKKIITTPHIMWDMYKNTRKDILERLETLRIAVKKENLQVDIHAAAEYFVDDNFAQLLNQKQPLLTFGENMVLIEFSMASHPLDLKEALFEMQVQGYQPVIAHPERYIYLEHNKEFYEDLRNHGCFFQLNLLSLGGYYGRSIMELAHYIAKKGYYELVGSDLHNFKQLIALHNPAITSPLKQLIETGKIKNAGL